MRSRQIPTTSSWAVTGEGDPVAGMATNLPGRSGLRAGRQTPADQQRLDDRVAAAQVTEPLHRVDRPPAREQLPAERVAVLAPQPAVLPEPLDRVRVQD